MKNLDYHAILTIHGLPTYDKKTIKRLSKWLNKLSDEFMIEDPKIFNGRFRARLMK